MTTLRITCPDHGDIEVDISAVTVLTDGDALIDCGRHWFLFRPFNLGTPARLIAVGANTVERFLAGLAEG